MQTGVESWDAYVEQGRLDDLATRRTANENRFWEAMTMSSNSDLTPEPGIYHGVPLGDYLSWRCVNNSALSYAARSMVHYRYAPQQEPTAAMQLGSLAHCGKLEPAAIGARYAVMPDLAGDIRKPDGSEYANVRATKEYKQRVAAWQATVGDREVVTSEQLEVMLGIVQSLTAHDFARRALCGPGPVEVCFVWDDPDSGVRCKARVDKWNDSAPDGTAIYDLKTTRDAGDFERAMVRFAYHRQAAFYLDGVRACTGAATVRFGIVAVEKDPPFAVRGAMVGPETIEAGRGEYKRLLKQIAQCRKTNDWPGYEDPREWQLPAWAMAQTEDEELGLTFHGEVVL